MVHISAQSFGLICILLQYICEVLADFEHVCTYNDYYGGRVSTRSLTTCGRRLTEFVISRCGGKPWLGDDHYFSSGIRKRRDIFLSKNEADSFLKGTRVKRSFESGIVCECCVNTCDQNEFNQYCQNRRRKRSVKEFVVPPKDGGKTHFTREDIKMVYREIEEQSKISSDMPLTSEDSKKMQLLEMTKRGNIEKKLTKNLQVPALDIENIILSRQENKDHHSTQLDTGAAIAYTLDEMNTRHRHAHSRKHHHI